MASLIRDRGFWVRDDNVAQDSHIVEDILEHDAYRTSLLPGIFAQAKVIVDIGAHIGVFATLAHQKSPEAKIICVEACPDNIEALKANVGSFAEVVHAACTYEEGPLGMLNAVRPNCESTGGSMVVSRAVLDVIDPNLNGYRYWKDDREMPKVTLEQLGDRFGFQKIDLLKLDCEGSEYSILEHSPMVKRTRMIVGEWHDERRWNEFRPRVLHSGWDYGFMFTDGYGGTGLFHLANRRWNKTIAVAVPPGIGDALWAMTKVEAICRSLDAERAELYICDGFPRRSKEFLEQFDFVSKAEYCEWSCVEGQSPLNADGTVNYAPSQVNWHGQYDWLLTPNVPLENGQRLEAWLPEFETNWRVMDKWHLSLSELNAGSGMFAKVGPYATVYASSVRGNTIEGHNRGPIWKPEDWLELTKLIRGELKLAVVFVGAEWDRGYIRSLEAIGCMADCDAVGSHSIGETMAIIRGSRFFLGYQSGLGIAATYMGVPTGMWWRPHGDSILPHAYQSFREDMATAWVPPDAGEKYMPLLYGRESPRQIVDAIWSRNW